MTEVGNLDTGLFWSIFIMVEMCNLFVKITDPTTTTIMIEVVRSMVRCF